MMLNLNEIANECLKEVESLNIPHGQINAFCVSHNKSTWGYCNHNRITNTNVIYISDVLLQDNSTLQGLKDTIIHEILHTCQGCQNHQKLWKSYANLMNVKYGYHIKRTSSASDKGISIDTMINTYKYCVECECCGSKHYYHKKSKVINNINNYQCSCGGHLKVVTL